MREKTINASAPVRIRGEELPEQLRLLEYGHSHTEVSKHRTEQ
jgi:hypothetical protein